MTERLGKLARRLGDKVAARLLEESRRIGCFLECHIKTVLAVWASAALLGGLGKVAVLAHNFQGAITDAMLPGLFAPYLAIAVAPAAAFFVASRAFPKERSLAQPSVRLATLGHWQNLDPDEAATNQHYGMAGLLVSLVVGLLITMAIRLATYFLAMPAMPPGAPQWALAAFEIMTFDLVFLCFMYSVCFTMALRGAPLFPRLLLLTWLYDLMMQLAIAKHVAEAGSLPAIVAGPFEDLLSGNIQKVLISMTIWVPYLLLSQRVNVTFRARVRVDARHGFAA